MSLPKRNLKNSCPTRWGNLFASIDRFLEQEPAIRQVLMADYKAAKLVLSVEDLKTLSTVKKILEPVSNLTDLLPCEPLFLVV